MQPPLSAHTPTLLLTPHRPGVAAGHDASLDVLVRFQAPDAPAAGVTRPSFDLALVLDRSGSMSGRPLAEAKRCAELIVDGLSPTDRLAIVTYDHRVDVRVPLQPVADRERLRAAIRAIHEGGHTDLHGGWRAGAEQLASAPRPTAIRRVLLLSDGCANHGLTDPTRIVEQCAEFSTGAHISTSTYGLGNHFNEDLMTAMATAGQGQACYGETVDDLREPFAAELDLLRATFATGVTLRILPASGVVARVLNRYPSDDEGYHLPAVAYGAEVWAMVRLTVPTADADTVDLADVTVTWRDAVGGRYELSVPTLRLPVLSATAHQNLPVDELVDRRLAELEAADLHERARAAFRDGNLDLVAALLAQARALGPRSPWIAEVAQALEELLAAGDDAVFSKEATYQTHRMRNRLTAKEETLRRVDAQRDPTWLMRKRRQGRTGG